MFTKESDIKYVGVNDDKLDLFEGLYPIEKGISYNSYVICSDKIAVMDSVDVHFGEQWLANIEKAIGTRTPDYIVIQHVEPDHSGSLGLFLNKYPDAKIVATVAAVNMLVNFVPEFPVKASAITVKDGDTLDLGGHTLRFFTAPLVHWPEVMVTLDVTSGVLFTADAFGTFGHFEDMDGWNDEARRYYTNIVGKFGKNVRNLLDKLKGLDFHVIAPLHGPVLSENLSHYWNLYDKWSAYTPEKEGVVIAYGSVYGSTAKAAEYFADLLRGLGEKEVVLIDLCRVHFSHAVAEAFKYDKLVLCAVTYEGGLFPPMYHFLHHLAQKNYANRRVAVMENGSWAPAAGRKMIEMIDGMNNMTVVEPMVTIKSLMTEDTRKSMEQAAKALLS